MLTMILRPSRYAALLQHGHMRLWEDEGLNLWLPWLGIQGDAFPVNQVTGTVELNGLVIQVPNKDQKTPQGVRVRGVPRNSQSILCRRDAEPGAPHWRKAAGVRLTTQMDVTIIESLTCLGAFFDNTAPEPEQIILPLSTWQRAHEGLVVVTQVSESTIHYRWVEGGVTAKVSIHEFLGVFTWVEDPKVVAPEGSAKPEAPKAPPMSFDRLSRLEASTVDLVTADELQALIKVARAAHDSSVSDPDYNLPDLDRALEELRTALALTTERQRQRQALLADFD